MHSSLLLAGALPLAAAEACYSVITKTNLITTVATTVEYSTIPADTNCVASEALPTGLSSTETWAPTTGVFQWNPEPEPTHEAPESVWAPTTGAFQWNPEPEPTGDASVPAEPVTTVPEQHFTTTFVTTYMDTSTVFSTSLKTVTRCDSEDGDCAEPTPSVVTITVPVSTTVCPFTKTVTSVGVSETSTAETVSVPEASTSTHVSAASVTASSSTTTNDDELPVKTLPAVDEPDFTPSESEGIPQVTITRSQPPAGTTSPSEEVDSSIEIPSVTITTSEAIQPTTTPSEEIPQQSTCIEGEDCTPALETTASVEIESTPIVSTETIATVTSDSELPQQTTSCTDEAGCGTFTATIPADETVTTIPVAGETTTCTTDEDNTVTIPVAGETTTPSAEETTTCTDEEEHPVTTPVADHETTATIPAAGETTTYTDEEVVPTTVPVAGETTTCTDDEEHPVTTPVAGHETTATIPAAGETTTCTDEDESPVTRPVGAETTTAPAAGETTTCTDEDESTATVPVAGETTTCTDEEESPVTRPVGPEATTVPAAGETTTCTDEEESPATVPAAGETTTCTDEDEAPVTRPVGPAVTTVPAAGETTTCTDEISQTQTYTRPGRPGRKSSSTSTADRALPTIVLPDLGAKTSTATRPVETTEAAAASSPVAQTSSSSVVSIATTSTTTSSAVSTTASTSTSSEPSLPTDLVRNYPRDIVDELQDNSMDMLKEFLKKNPNSGCTLENVSIRREWGDLTRAQREDYINAVLTMMSLPSKYSKTVAGARTRYDDFVVTHQAQTNYIHNSANFLGWHRYYIHGFEKALKTECGYNGVMPYWGWDRYADDLFNSPMFSGDSDSLGGNAGRSGCVETGPFKNLKVNLGPGSNTAYNPRCLNRKMSESAARYTKVSVTYPLITQSNDITTFQDRMQSGDNVHSAGHWTVGGNPGNDIYVSPGDPYFHLHHAGIDRLWWIWQLQDLETRTKAVGGTNLRTKQAGSLDEMINLGLNGGNFKLGATLNTMGGLNGDMCYIYY